MTERSVAVVTGATAGIGQWIALGLARAGLHTILAARNPVRGAETQAWIAARAPDAETELVLADLSLLSQARDAAGQIAAAHPRLAVLVNNAGLCAPRRVETTEGHELTLAVNHLAPHVLTRVLEPALRAAAPSRIVNIGSAASDRLRLDLDDLEGRHSFGMPRSYGRSKLALMMATYAWAQRLAGTGVTANVVHPGVVATGIAAVPGIAGLIWGLGMPFMLTPEQGADTPLHVALAPELAGITSTYFKRRKAAAPNCQALDPAIVARLWAETERLSG
jgi:NAD(P)-dependent dehydrogenase (short-subunit alcohol dehydrogenase family)